MPKAMTAKRPKGFGCAVALVGVVFAGSLAATFLVATGPLARAVRSRSWVPGRCTIVSSAVRRHRGDSDTYDVDVRYTWPLAGRTFEGSRYDLFGASTSNRSRWEAIARRLQPGTTVDCWIDPQRPSEATIVRAVDVVGLLLTFLPLAIAVLSGFGLRALFRRGLGPDRRPVQAPPVIVVEAGPVALKPASTPAVRFAGASIVAVFWNAIVWLGFWHAAFGSGPGGFHRLMAAMFLLFAATGAYLVFAAGRALVALAAPRVRVTASARQVRLGERLSVDWKFGGNSEAIASVAVALVGSEIARVRRSGGTGGSSTERLVRSFARVPVANAAGAAGPRGIGTVNVPQDTVPTFSAPNNEIAWAIVVEASLRHLPDLREEFPVVLLPEGR